MLQPNQHTGRFFADSHRSGCTHSPLRFHVSQPRLQAMVPRPSPSSLSALDTIEHHPEWTASIRCLLVCSLLAFPTKIDQAMEYFTPCVEEHMNGTNPIPYDWLHKLQSALTQLCSDYYSEDNFSFCAVVLSFFSFLQRSGASDRCSSSSPTPRGASCSRSGRTASSNCATSCIPSSELTPSNPHCTTSKKPSRSSPPRKSF